MLVIIKNSHGVTIRDNIPVLSPPQTKMNQGLAIYTMMKEVRNGIEEKRPIEVPLFANGVAEEIGISTSGDSIHLIVRAHHARHFPFHYTASERHVECVLHLLLAHLSK